MEDAQALYNSLVEPFNEFEITRRENAKTLSETSYRLKLNEKIFGELCEERKKQGKLIFFF